MHCMVIMPPIFPKLSSKFNASFKIMIGLERRLHFCKRPIDCLYIITTNKIVACVYRRYDAFNRGTIGK